ncbi:MAG: hypothetical protein ACO2Y5_03425 [Nitrosopumilaceae archaeon]|uniref:Uncharacterized protein n=1 Tax=Candidatus Nitrosomaritimum aestuariumsis TaxID=3342354 RepID=A0AC60W3L5_9ARCH|nr:hypothetical protein [Nitrosopumilaceae archaeon]
MNFLKDKVKKYQEKKLAEAEEKLKFYTLAKTRLEKQLELTNDEEFKRIKKEIEKHREFIDIWKNNVASINKQIKKLNH